MLPAKSHCNFDFRGHTGRRTLPASSISLHGLYFDWQQGRDRALALRVHIKPAGGALVDHFRVELEAAVAVDGTGEPSHTVDHGSDAAQVVHLATSAPFALRCGETRAQILSDFLNQSQG